MAASDRLRTAPLADLLAAYAAIIDEFVRRGVSRTRDAPTGQVAEALVAKALDADLAPNSEKSWDCTCRDGGRKVQVKARVLSKDNPSALRHRQLSPFRSWDFDAAVIVLFAADYGVERATEIPRSVIEPAGAWNKHVNGWVVHARDALLDQGRDLTELMRKTLAEWRDEA